MISYKVFRHYLVEKDISKTYLYENVGISWNVITKLMKDEPVRLDVLVKICTHFDIPIEKVIEIKRSPSD